NRVALGRAPPSSAARLRLPLAPAPVWPPLAADLYANIAPPPAPDSLVFAPGQPAVARRPPRRGRLRLRQRQPSLKPPPDRIAAGRLHLLPAARCNGRHRPVPVRYWLLPAVVVLGRSRAAPARRQHRLRSAASLPP